MKTEISEVNIKNVLAMLKEQLADLSRLAELEKMTTEIKEDLVLIRTEAEEEIRLEVHSKGFSRGRLVVDYVAKDLLIIALEQSIKRMEKEEVELGKGLVVKLKDLLRSLYD